LVVTGKSARRTVFDAGAKADDQSGGSHRMNHNRSGHFTPPSEAHRRIAHRRRLACCAAVDLKAMSFKIIKVIQTTAALAKLDPRKAVGNLVCSDRKFCRHRNEMC
jgi:hypothetical protein